MFRNKQITQKQNNHTNNCLSPTNSNSPHPQLLLFNQQIHQIYANIISQWSVHFHNICSSWVKDSIIKYQSCYQPNQSKSLIQIIKKQTQSISEVFLRSLSNSQNLYLKVQGELITNQKYRALSLTKKKQLLTKSKSMSLKSKKNRSFSMFKMIKSSPQSTVSHQLLKPKISNTLFHEILSQKHNYKIGKKIESKPNLNGQIHYKEERQPKNSNSFINFQSSQIVSKILLPFSLSQLNKTYESKQNTDNQLKLESTNEQFCKKSKETINNEKEIIKAQNQIQVSYKEKESVLEDFIKNCKKINLPISEKLTQIFKSMLSSQNIQREDLLFLKESFSKLKKLIELECKEDKKIKIQNYVKASLRTLNYIILNTKTEINNLRELIEHSILKLSSLISTQ